MFQFRYYQRECHEAIQQGYRENIRRQLAVLATGGGKTIVFAHLPTIIPGRTLVIAHREELLIQAGRKIISVNPELTVALEQADKYARGDEDIIIGSVQTLSRNDCKRLRRLIKYGGPIVNLIIDEAHHTNCNTYQQIIDCLKEYCPDLFVLGVTATPKRGDGKGLEKIFQKIVYSKDLRALIQEGWLVDIQTHKIASAVSLDGLHSSLGDYKQDELAERLVTDERNSTAIAGWLKYARNKKTIVFCINVEHTQQICDLMCRQGVAAEMVIGDTPPELRTAIFRRFTSGETMVLVNCGVAIEGYDEASIECVLDLAPTKSAARYQQKLGRGTRTNCEIDSADTIESRLERIASSSKPFLLHLDVTDNCTTHPPVSIADLFGVPRKMKLKGEGIASVARKIEQALAEAPNIDINKVKSIEHLQKLKVEALRINIWDIEPPKEVKEHSRLSWLKSGDEYRLNVDRNESIIIRENTLGHFEAWEETTSSSGIQLKELGSEPTLEALFTRADEYVEGNYEDRLVLLSHNAKWKKDSASEKQFNLLQRQHFPVRSGNDGYEVSDGAGGWLKLTKGRAGAMITQFFSRQKTAA